MKPKIMDKLSDHGYPTHSKYYQNAHKAADIAEKKKFPRGYEKLKKIEHKLNKHELMGKNTKEGKIEVEKRFKKYKSEIAFHEEQEHKNIKKLQKKT
jgi:hypothetical protein